MAPPTLVDVPGAPRLHESQQPRVTVDPPDVAVEAIDADERRVTLTFSTYQAVRVRTIDVLRKTPDTFRAFAVVEVADSPWIEELRAALAVVDETADFLDRAHHWMLHAGDAVVEVVAWELDWVGG